MYSVEDEHMSTVVNFKKMIPKIEIYLNYHAVNSLFLDASAQEV